MWPFRRRGKKEKKSRTVEKVIAGIIIGGAISSIVGKKLIEKHDREEQEKKHEKDREDGTEG